MGPLRRYVRLAAKVAPPLGLLAAVAAAVRSRRGVEVWHVAVDESPGQLPGHGEGP